MQAIPKIEASLLFPRATVVDKTGVGTGPWLSLTDQPDLRLNPKIWFKLFVEGLTLHNKGLALAGRSERILDLGCGSGWFSIEAARRNVTTQVVAVDIDASQIAWAKGYCSHLEDKGVRMGRISFLEQDIANFPWQKDEQGFDLVYAGFILSRVGEPGQVLEGIYKALRPGGWLIYYDATEPPAKNLDVLACTQHRLTGWRDPASDPWAWRRAWLQRYRYDIVRTLARSKEPSESHLMSRIEELFAVHHQERRRSFIDMYLSGGRRRTLWRTALIPTFKFADDLITRLGLLDGACRYVLAQKR